MNLHPVLEKQIKKHLLPHLADDRDLAPFLASISTYYHTIERDKKISEHAFMISEREYQEVLTNLKEQRAVELKSILQINQIISTIEQNAAPLDGNQLDLLFVVDFLRKQVEKMKALEEELLEARDRAELQAHAKSNFLSVMSHEIRTPLNAIIGNIHLLDTEPHLPEQKTYIRTLNIAADNLLSLVNDILDFNKIDEGRIIFQKKDIDLRSLVSNIRLGNGLRAQERENKVHILIDEDIPEYVMGDDVRLTQILNNLLTNAIKFTYQGTIIIELMLETSDEDALSISFNVKDTGIGIDASAQEKIFERFTQADSEITRQYGGSGLGLTIVSRLLELQGSKIFLESELGKGSRFYFTQTFTRSSKQREERFAPQELRKDLHQKKILLVEDVRFNIDMAEKMLSNWNAEVFIAENGQEALAFLKQARVDIILMDVQMPVMDGLTAARIIRETDQQTPIIALTASASTEIQQNVVACGMNDYISKPFNPDDLYAILKQFLSN